MTIIEYAEKIGLQKYLNNQSIDILERAQKAIENKEEYHVSVSPRSERLLLQTIILKYEGYLEGCADGRAAAIEEIIDLIDAYPANLDRRTEETHLIFATLSEIIIHIRQLKEEKNELIVF